MSGRIVRQSKFRNVYSQAAKPENTYIGTKLAGHAWDSNFMCANTKSFAMLWHSVGGGVFTVIPQERQGKLGEVPLISVHKAPVLDIEFNPFNENLIASASEDCNICICDIPEGGLKENLSTPVQTLRGHKRKVGTVNFHPCANNILATSSSDYSVKIWDIEKGEDLFTIGGHTDIIQSCAWNKDGSRIASACRDKKLRIIDPRGQSVSSEVLCHQGVKGLRCCWMTDKDKIVTTGFTKSVEREFCIWDPRSLTEPLCRQTIDTGSGVIMPFYDPDTSLLFLAGKGDGNIRFYEIVDEKPFFHFINSHKSSVPQRGMAMLPKRAVNVSQCEVVRLFKAENAKVEPISFIVPRKSDLYQDDLFPSAYAGVPTATAEAWKSGTDAMPDTSFSMAPGFVAPVRPSSDFKPVQKEEVKPKTEAELLKENEQMKARIAFLEAEMAKKDAIIKDLQQ